MVIPQGIRFVKRGIKKTQITNGMAHLGKSSPPYSEWTFQESPFFIGGPDFKEVGENRFIGGGRINKKYTGLVSFTEDGDFEEVLRLPSNSDIRQ